MAYLRYLRASDFRSTVKDGNLATTFRQNRMKNDVLL